MTNQLGGWSVSWQGVFGAGHVCCMGPPNQIPPGTTVQAGIQAADSNAVYAPDGSHRREHARRTPTSSRSARRPTPKASATTRRPRCRPTSRR